MADNALGNETFEDLEQLETEINNLLNMQQVFSKEREKDEATLKGLKSLSEQFQSKINETALLLINKRNQYIKLTMDVCVINYKESADNLIHAFRDIFVYSKIMRKIGITAFSMFINYL